MSTVYTAYALYGIWGKYYNRSSLVKASCSDQTAANEMVQLEELEEQDQDDDDDEE